MREMTLQQMTARDKLIKWRVGALFMEAGTGKTRVAVELARDCEGGGFGAVDWSAANDTLRNVLGGGRGGKMGRIWLRCSVLWR